MVDYMIYNVTWDEYTIRPTLEKAKAWIKKEIEYYPDAKESDFVIYKRERIDA